MLWSVIFVGCFQNEAREGTLAPVHNTPSSEGSSITQPSSFGSGSLLEGGGNGSQEFGTPPPQLEAFTIFLEDDDGDFERDSILAVEGAERDWELSLEGDVIGLHSPGMVDLSVLNNRAVSMQVTAPYWSDNDRSIAISDAVGLAYVGGPSAPELLRQHFGEDVVQYGETLAQVIEPTMYGTVLIAYSSVDVLTDEGLVSVLPGELTPVTIDGQVWELAVHTSYVVLDEDSDVDCVTRASLLSLEMIRADAPRQDLVDRPDGLSKGAYGCG